MDVGTNGRGSTPTRIENAVVLRLHQATAAAGKQEACGLLFGCRGSIREATVARNVAAEPHHRFEIDPVHLFDAYRRDRAGPDRLIGCWHSHPNGVGQPSRHDRAGVSDMEWLWLIVAAGRIYAWRPVEEGRPAEQGFEAVALIDGSL